MAINIHHQVKDAGAPEASLNQRVFEVAAIGVPQVVDRRGDLEPHFQAGKHLLVFDDADELRDLVKAALHELPAAEQLGVAARKAVLSGHTYMHRMRQLLAGITAAQVT